MLEMEKDEITLDGETFRRSDLLLQLDRLVESRHFRNSKRYPRLLQFVVEQTLSGKTESLKERTLGMDVFERPGDYDTNQDPIVRVTAGEVRKRLAQYYQEPGHEHEVRIDLPPGAYVPHFVRTARVESEREPQVQPGTEVPQRPTDDVVHTPAPEQEPAIVQAPRTSSARFRVSHAMWGLLAFLLVVGIVGGWMLHRRQAEPALDFIWHTPLASPNPFTIVIGVHSLDDSGQEKLSDTRSKESTDHHTTDMLDLMLRADMVPVSDIMSYSRVTDLLAKKDHHYITMGSMDATMEQIRSGPLVLVGGLDNVWTLRLTSKLRYRFEQRMISANAIFDSEQPGKVWRFDNMQDAAATTKDFALVASYFDTTIDQWVVVVAGIGKSGTQVAAEFLTNENGLRAWMDQYHSGNQAKNKNVEIVLSTDVVEGKTGPPRVVASTSW